MLVAKGPSPKMNTADANDQFMLLSARARRPEKATHYIIGKQM